MKRAIMATLLALGLFATGLLAKDIKGEFVKFDENEGITLKVDDAEKTFKVSETAKLTAGKKTVAREKFAKAFQKVQPKATVTITVDDKDVVTEVKPERKKKDKSDK